MAALSSPVAHGQADPQKQIDELRGALPKFAIPMREVGDRFQNMYFAAKEVVKMKTPADNGIAYTGKSEPGDVPK